MEKCFLIVKTGSSGARLKDLYKAKVNLESGEKTLSGYTRLVGNWYRAAVAACKSKGVKGTLSVFLHDRSDVDELVHNYYKSFIKMKHTLDWIPVAILNLDEVEYERIADTKHIEFMKAKYASGEYIKESNNTFRFRAYEKEAQGGFCNFNQQNLVIKELKQKHREEMAEYLAAAIAEHITLVNEPKPSANEQQFNNLFE